VPTSSRIAAGERCFGRYRIDRELGRGGMGVVMLAQDEELGMPVALKLLPEAVADDTEGITRLKTEVLRGMNLTHPGIVRVHTFERDESHAAIVMEFVAGETLAERKAQEPEHCFDCAQILPWLEQLCAALDYAHDEGRTAHRDLKPRNLMLTNEGRLKVADFGLAALLTESLTRVGTRADAVGTPPYMSPQQVMGKPATRSDDMYALGATIYDLLTGRPPFFRGDVFAQVLHAAPPTMAQRRAELGVTSKAPIPPSWENAVAACLSKDAASRPPSGAALLAILRESGAVAQPAPVVRVRVTKPAPAPAADTQAHETTKTAPYSPPTESRPAPATVNPMPAVTWNPVQHRKSKAAGTGFFGKAAVTVIAAAIVAGGLHTVRRGALASAPTPAPSPAPATVEKPKPPGFNHLGAQSLQPAAELGAKKSGASR
jgi:serine/threonine protein kinase